MKKIAIFAFLLSLSILALSPALVSADLQEGCPGGGTICLSNPLGNINSPQALIGRAINSILGVVGSIALLMFVYGGLTWMTSAGSAEKVEKGRNILLWSAIGLVVIFSAYGLTRFVLSTIAQ